MSDDLITNTTTAGLLVRRHMRTKLDLLGMTWKEHKGLLDSTFVVTGTLRQWQRLLIWIQAFERN